MSILKSFYGCSLRFKSLGLQKSAIESWCLIKIRSLTQLFCDPSRPQVSDRLHVLEGQGKKRTIGWKYPSCKAILQLQPGHIALRGLETQALGRMEKIKDDQHGETGSRELSQTRSIGGGDGGNESNQELRQTTGKGDGGKKSNRELGQTTGRKRKSLLNSTKIPNKINLVVIGTGGPGTPQSLLITTELTRYMFNCGGGTQRLATMGKGLRSAAFAKIAGLEHIFITHNSWENTGGLLGMAMTLEGQKNPGAKLLFKTKTQDPVTNLEVEVPEITIHGPPDVEKGALMAKKFAVSANMNIVKAEGKYEDNALTISPVQFYKEDSEASMIQGTEEEETGPGPHKKRKRESSNDEPYSNVAFAYICEPKPPLPKINVEKCVDAGITMGPMVGELQRGNSVTLKDGRVVHPHQVTDTPNVDSRPFLVLECRSLDFLPSLTKCSELQPYVTEESEKSFAVIVHMTPAQVFNSSEYQSWIRRFHSSTDHLVMNEEAQAADLIRVRDHQARLNIVSKDVFPMLPENGNDTTMEMLAEEGESSTQKLLSAQDFKQKKGKIVKACSGLHYVYRGNNLGFQIEVDEFKCQELQDEYLSDPTVQDQLKTLRQAVPETSSTSSYDTDDDDEESLTKYPKVVFLGTGSSEPNKIRAQSCIVVQLSKDTVFILDCGEDSYGQMYRFYGEAKTNRILRKVKAIFVSHMHADHHLGLFSLLMERKKAFDAKDVPFTPVLLLAPIQMRRWLTYYQTELGPITHLFRFVKHQQNLKDFDTLQLSTATFDDVQKELNLTEFKPVTVYHCPNAFGVVFSHKSGFKTVYSGDTRPSDNLVKEGMGCDLLIHEATHDDSLLKHAKATKHSTFSEAVNVGERMKAKSVILTHFSQRYAHMIPLFDTQLPPNVGIAFDNMQVHPGNLQHLSKMIPLLTTLFDEELRKLRTLHIKRLRDLDEMVMKQGAKSSR